MPTVCADFKGDELERFVLGRVSAERAQELAAHAAACTPCRQILDDEMAFVEDLREALSLLALSSEDLPSAQVLPIPERDRRTSLRASCDAPAILRYVADQGKEHFARGRQVDSSPGGAGFLLREPLPVRVVAEVEVEEECFKGVVRYCDASDRGFRVGIIRVRV